MSGFFQWLEKQYSNGLSLHQICVLLATPCCIIVVSTIIFFFCGIFSKDLCTNVRLHISNIKLLKYQNSCFKIWIYQNSQLHFFLTNYRYINVNVVIKSTSDALSCILVVGKVLWINYGIMEKVRYCGKDYGTHIYHVYRVIYILICVIENKLISCPLFDWMMHCLYLFRNS